MADCLSVIQLTFSHTLLNSEFYVYIVKVVNSKAKLLEEATKIEKLLLFYKDISIH